MHFSTHYLHNAVQKWKIYIIQGINRENNKELQHYFNKFSQKYQKR